MGASRRRAEAVMNFAAAAVVRVGSGRSNAEVVMLDSLTVLVILALGCAVGALVTLALLACWCFREIAGKRLVIIRSRGGEELPAIWAAVRKPTSEPAFPSELDSEG